MALSKNLISQFVKVTSNNTKQTEDTYLYGTIVEYGGSQYVRLDGSDLLTPYTSTVVVKTGERVRVSVGRHTATVTGNVSSPAARNANNIGNYYVADDMVGDDDGVSFTWLMAPDVTAYSGDVRFSIKLYEKQDDKITKSFNTRPGTGRVLGGLDVEQQVTPEQQLTILEKIEADVKMDIDKYMETTSKQKVDEYVNASAKSSRGRC